MSLKDNKYKIIEYTVLFVGILVYAFLFLFFFKDSNSARLLITALAVLFYVTWGVIHHFLEKRLTLEIAFEYILIGFLTFLLVLVSLSG